MTADSNAATVPAGARNACGSTARNLSRTNVAPRKPTKALSPRIQQLAVMPAGRLCIVSVVLIVRTAHASVRLLVLAAFTAATPWFRSHFSKRFISITSNALILSNVEEYVSQSSFVVPAIDTTAKSIPLLPQNNE